MEREFTNSIVHGAPANTIRRVIFCENPLFSHCMFQFIIQHFAIQKKRKKIYLATLSRPFVVIERKKRVLFVNMNDVECNSICTS